MDDGSRPTLDGGTATIAGDASTATPTIVRVSALAPGSTVGRYVVLEAAHAQLDLTLMSALAWNGDIALEFARLLARIRPGDPRARQVAQEVLAAYRRAPGFSRDVETVQRLLDTLPPAPAPSRGATHH